MKYLTPVGFGTAIREVRKTQDLLNEAVDKEAREAYEALIEHMVRVGTGTMSTFGERNLEKIDTSGLIPLSKLSCIDVPMGFYGVVNEYGDHYVVTHTDSKGKSVRMVEALYYNPDSPVSGAIARSYDTDKLWLDGRMYGLTLTHENVDHLSAFVQEGWPEEKNCHQPA